MTKLPEWLDDRCRKAFSEMSGQYQEPVFAFMFINGFEAACDIFAERDKVLRDALYVFGDTDFEGTLADRIANASEALAKVKEIEEE